MKIIQPNDGLGSEIEIGASGPTSGGLAVFFKRLNQTDQLNDLGHINCGPKPARGLAAIETVNVLAAVDPNTAPFPRQVATINFAVADGLIAGLVNATRGKSERQFVSYAAGKIQELVVVLITGGAVDGAEHDPTLAIDFSHIDTSSTAGIKIRGRVVDDGYFGGPRKLVGNSIQCSADNDFWEPVFVKFNIDTSKNQLKRTNRPNKVHHEFVVDIGSNRSIYSLCLCKNTGLLDEKPSTSGVIPHLAEARKFDLAKTGNGQKNQNSGDFRFHFLLLVWLFLVV